MPSMGGFWGIVDRLRVPSQRGNRKARREAQARYDRIRAQASSSPRAIPPRTGRTR